mgnify:CR=1 FL=1
MVSCIRNQNTKEKVENMKLPDHLGGHLNKVHTDMSTFLYLKEKYEI